MAAVGEGSSEALRAGVAGGRWWLCVLVLALTGCAAAGSDVHLAPLYTRIARAENGVDTEAVGGFYRHIRTEPGSERYRSELTLGPLAGLDRNGPDDWRARYLVPLGYARRSGLESASMLAPFYSWSRQELADGNLDANLFTIVGLIYQHNEEKGSNLAWFPFYGDLDDVLTFDRIHWFLWPLFVATRRGENRSYNVLFPILHRSRGGARDSWRVWPLVGRTRRPGSYDRRFALWPFFHYQDDLLGTRRPERTWMVWPLVGRTRRGGYRAITLLWPLYGFAYDKESDFYAMDFPFFVNRIQRGPGELERTRLWPWFSHMEAEGLEATNLLWPIFHWRREKSDSMERKSFYAIPLWQSWRRTDLASGETSSWHKLFPVFQRERLGNHVRGSFPTLDPFWRNDLIDRHYGWLWKLWEWEGHGAVRRERSILGLWRRERDAGEDRRSFTGLWAGRTYRSEGRRVRERSLLFGLLRWRVTDGEGFDMLPAAFPGPGWPRERVLAPGAHLRDSTD